LDQQKISITASEMLAMTSPDVKISDEQQKQLELLVENLPWFTCGQLLLLKGMKQRRHPLFGARLPFVSLYATSRGRLYDFLQQVNDDLQEQPVAAPAIAAPVAAATDIAAADSFEVMPADPVCEKVVKVQPEPSEPPLAAPQPPLTVRYEELINNFLVAQPQRIGYPNANETETTTLIFNELAQDLVSETLADIYLAQGLLVKAKQVYTKLSLLYPEKKAYFAARFAAASQPQRATVSS
jgi:hypothetical protein